MRSSLSVTTHSQKCLIKHTGSQYCIYIGRSYVNTLFYYVSSAVFVLQNFLACGVAEQTGPQPKLSVHKCHASGHGVSSVATSLHTPPAAVQKRTHTICSRIQSVRRVSAVAVRSNKGITQLRQGLFCDHTPTSVWSPTSCLAILRL